MVDPNPVREAVIEKIRDMGIPFERHDHAPVMTIAASAELEDYCEACSVKTLFLREKNRYFLLMLPGAKRFQSKALAAAAGMKHVSFGSPEKLSEYLGTYPGAVSCLALLNDTEHHVELFIDAEVLDMEKIDCHPTTNDCSLRIAVKDILTVFLPAVGHEPHPVELGRRDPTSV